MSLISKEHQEKILKRLEEKKVLRTGHYILKSGKHTGEYIDKERVYMHAYDSLLSDICKNMAYAVYDSGVIDIDVVVAPETGGILLQYLVAGHLSFMIGKDVYGAYAKWKEDKGRVYDPMFGFGKKGMKDVVVRYDSFAFRDAYQKILPSSKVLIVDDVLTTGTTLRPLIDAVRLSRGSVEHVAVIWNRGDVQASDLGVEKLFSVIDKPIESWSANNCPMCKKGVPLNILK